MRFILALVVGSALFASNTPSFADQPATRPAGVAVVELFTSEGCSSCPPADEVLGKLVAETEKTGVKVFALAFHVDYWNRLGWMDRFSSPAYSQRQRDYAEAARTRQVYTPQMIVNGSPAGFVGSDESRARREIAGALAKPVTVEVSMKPTLAKQSVKIDYAVSGDSAGAVLNIAVVERDLLTEVPRGENAGRKLEHQNVVRVFRTVDLKVTSGTVTVELPPDVNPAKASIVSFVQDAKSRQVRGATLTAIMAK